jgi:adenylylsulfate kinase-like enzyme
MPERIYPQNLFKQVDECEISNMIEAQKPYKLPLNTDITVFTEKQEKSARNIIDYHHMFELNK